MGDLCARDLSDMSNETRVRLVSYAARFATGEQVTEQWTFYPAGKPTTVTCTCSGIRIEDGRMAMLVIGKSVADANPEDLRGIEALRHTRVKVSLFRWEDGCCLMRNPIALQAYPEADHQFQDRFLIASDAQRAVTVLAEGDVYSDIVRVRTARGERWHDIDARKTRDPVTGEDAVLVNERDLTDLVRAEEALRVSERRLAHLVEHLPAGAAYVEGETIFLNRAAEEISGYSRDEVSTLDAWFRAAYPDTHEDIRQRYGAARAAGAPISVELQITRKDGALRWIHFSAYLTDRGEIWLIQDVTEHRQALKALRRERAMLQSLIDSMPDIVFFKDRDGQYLKYNRAALEYAGIPAPADGPTGRSDRDLFDEDTAARRRHTDGVAMEQGSSRTEEWFVYPDGRRVLVETAKAACRDGDGNVLGVVGISRDITERRQTEDQLRRERALLQGLVDAIPDAVFFKDRDDVLRKVNHAFAVWLGKSPENLIGLKCHDVWFPELAEEIRHNDVLVYTEDRPRRNEEIIPLPDGSSICVEMLKAPIRDHTGAPLGLIGIGRDITERKRIEEALRRSEAEKGHLANHDALTGLPNRRLFGDRLDMALARSQRSGRCAAILFIDLDGFKQVNDALGHACGDHVLHATAARISGCLRKTDTVARVGGDEFCVILENVTSTQAVSRLANTIIEMVSRPIAVEGQEVTIGASIGIALYPQDAGAARALLVLADNAMYKAKEIGPGQHVFWSGGMCISYESAMEPTHDAAPADSVR